MKPKKHLRKLVPYLTKVADILETMQDELATSYNNIHDEAEKAEIITIMTMIEDWTERNDETYHEITHELSKMKQGILFYDMSEGTLKMDVTEGDEPLREILNGSHLDMLLHDEHIDKQRWVRGRVKFGINEKCIFTSRSGDTYEVKDADHARIKISGAIFGLVE